MDVHPRRLMTESVSHVIVLEFLLLAERREVDLCPGHQAVLPLFTARWGRGIDERGENRLLLADESVELEK